MTAAKTTAATAGESGSEHKGRIEDLAVVVARWLRYFFNPGDVMELRCLDVSRPTYKNAHIESGFYDYESLEKMALDAVTTSRNAVGVYFTINPLRKDILSRRANRLAIAGKGDAAEDVNVTERRWLPIDIDPLRLRGISATAEEKEYARVMAIAVKDYLANEGWSLPIFADSGNGYHLFYRVAMPNTDASRDTMRSVLYWLGHKFDTPQCKVDRSVFNASRIMKIPGTQARKGEDMKDRPHRRGKLLSVPGISDSELLAGL